MEQQPAVDLSIRALVEAQHGVVARRQLLAAGIGPERIRSWLTNGRLLRHGRGVYTLGHSLLAREGRWMAAVLTCGEGAVLSHQSAAALWGLRPGGGSRIHVTVRDNGRRVRSDGSVVHRSTIAVASFGTTHRGIRVTTVPRTLLDLASAVPAHHLRRAVEQAEQLERFDLRAVDAALAAHRGRAGAPALVALLRDMQQHGITRTRSDVESALLHLCLAHRLPRPQVNRYDNGKEVDFRWPSRRLIVEVDGWTYHRSRRAFSADRARDRDALRHGWRVARFTASEVEREPHRVAAELRALL